jgi:hypothetical protein
MTTTKIVAVLFTAISLLSSAHALRLSHDDNKTYPLTPSLNFTNGQSYSDVCLAVTDGSGHYGYISIHDNHELYHVK